MFTKSELTLLLSAIDMWERGDSGKMLAAIMASAISRDKEAGDKKLDELTKKDEVEKELRKRQAIFIKAKILEQLIALEASE